MYGSFFQKSIPIETEKSEKFAIEQLLNGFFLLCILDGVINCLLSWYDMIFYQNVQIIPKSLKKLIPETIIQDSKAYGIERSRHLILRKIVRTTLDCVKLYFGFYGYMWHLTELFTKLTFADIHFETFVSPLYIFGLNFIGFLEDLPFLWHKIFIINRKYEHIHTSQYFFIEYLSMFVIRQIIMFPIVTTTDTIMKSTNNYVYIWLTAFSCIIQLGIDYFTPSLTIKRPIKVLDNGDLKDEIIDLCEKFKFPLENIYYVNDMNHESIYPVQIIGPWYRKRILLYKSLFLDDKNVDKIRLHVELEEALAIIGQKLGQWKNNHYIKTFILHQIKYFFVFIGSGYIFKNCHLYQDLGFSKNICPAICAYIIVLRYFLSTYCTIADFIINLIKQKFIQNADDFALRLHYGVPLRLALSRICLNVEEYPLWDWIEMTSYRNIPTLIERLMHLFALNIDKEDATEWREWMDSDVVTDNSSNDEDVNDNQITNDENELLLKSNNQETSKIQTLTATNSSDDEKSDEFLEFMFSHSQRIIPTAYDNPFAQIHFKSYQDDEKEQVKNEITKELMKVLEIKKEPKVVKSCNLRTISRNVKTKKSFKAPKLRPSKLKNKPIMYTKIREEEEEEEEKEEKNKVKVE